MELAAYCSRTRNNLKKLAFTLPELRNKLPEIAFFEKFMGRKSTYTEKTAREICSRIAGGTPLREICRDEKMPAWQTVYGWLEAHPEFAKRFAHARDIGFDAIAEEALQIADTPQIGEIEETSADGKKVRREDMLGHRKLQVETRLKLLAKWAPKKYGESIRQELTGAGGGPIQMQFSAVDADL